MNKLDFLRRLDKELSVLDKQERREILAFYEERFYNGTIYENKTEEEVIAELERPEIIARNVLDEYGVSPKFVKVKEERYSNVSGFKVVMLILFDVFIATSVIPALYSAAVAVIGSSFTWVTTLGLVLGDVSAVDQYVFGFATAAYILLFLFGLVILEAALWFTRTLIKWHLNVFKAKNREKTIKKLSHWSLDSWFKKHRGAKRLKNLALIGALVGILYSGYWIANHYDWVQAEYEHGEIADDTITESFTSELAAGDTWTINTNLENIAVELVQGSNDDVVIKHTYFEDDNFTYNIDLENNELTVANDTTPSINFFWDPSDIFNLISGTRNVVRIELPADLVLEDADLITSNGSVYIRNIDFDNINVSTSNASVNMINTEVKYDATIKSSNGKVSVTNALIEGKLDVITSNSMIEVTEVEVEKDVLLKSTNGRVQVIDVQSNGNGTLNIDTSNNGVKVNATGFRVYIIETSNGKVSLDNLNTVLTPATSITVVTSNSAIDASDVYGDVISMTTSNGDIDFQNEDTSFHPSDLNLHTSSYNDIETNVTE